MTRNPYAPPGADVASVPHAGSIRVYSPMQVVGGAALGGPMGLIYFLWANFGALGNDRLERKTLMLGAISVLVLIITLPLLPDWFPSLPFTVAYVLIGRHVSETHQLTKRVISESSLYVFHSNWRVVGLGLLSFVASFVVIAGPLMLLAYFGIWDPMGIA